MSGYRDYTVVIRLKSPVVTPFQSDTIFGHICWAVRFLKWEEEDRLAKFLDSYNEAPPLLVSNGFPEGYLSKPVLPPVTQDFLGRIFQDKDLIEKSYRIKTIKELDIIPVSTLKLLQRETITSEKLFSAIDKSFKEIESMKAGHENTVVQHNTINRMGIKSEGGLYSQEETFFAKNSGVFNIYLKTNYFSYEELKKIFSYISTDGFGRDKSTGKGHFEFEIKDGIDLPEAEKPNAFMTLSSYVPSDNDPVKGYYSLLHKYGKLGGVYAKGVPEVKGNPFKKPLIMFSTGSAFYDEYERDKTYGQLLDNVHQNKDIRHYAYAFPIGINIKDKHEEI